MNGQRLRAAWICKRSECRASFGAITTQAVSGETFHCWKESQLNCEFRAAIVSPSAPVTERYTPPTWKIPAASATAPVM